MRQEQFDVVVDLTEEMRISAKFKDFHHFVVSNDTGEDLMPKEEFNKLYRELIFE